MILQKTVAIGPDDTLGSLYFNQLFPLGVEAMLEAADLVVVQGGRLELLKVRQEGGAKISAAEFFRSAALAVGSAIDDRKIFSEAA
ncbi:hypothetical protein U0R22_003763 [Mesorhizobium huakuii]|uniref:Carbohydrate kinase PfkB domain-containing protein n=1 Tax=Mesorhizobium huakuii TaxID=28104 RepID=A0ABZ0VTN6_9HYPH|nr:hypothetical protein [Mesorhizobium huakuii]WQB99579.1 hypothetical protein U0R22_003763 [Mesorhizobium huakuii]